MRSTYLISFVLPVSLLLISLADAQDFNGKLQGEYAVTTTRICAQSQAGFAPPALQALSPTSLQTSIIESVQTFNGDGTFTSAGRAMALFANQAGVGQFPIAEQVFTCSGTYQVNEDNTFSQQESCAGSILTGPTANQTFTSTGGGVATGRIHDKMIFIKNTTASLTTFTFSAIGPFTRICGFSATGVKIKNKPED
jgi:hypothetical protein